MGKRKSTDTLSLDLKEQKNVSKDVEDIKKKIKTGEITVKEERKAQKITAEKKRGLIFISHLPHGFYENELKSYFKQFGKVTNVKVCRSNRTGRSKGYGYVEFSHPEVAKIAGETMNNYLMFKKRLSVEYIPYEKRPKSLFHGKSSTESVYSAKTRRNKQYVANLTASEEKYSSRLKKRLSRLNKKMKKLSDVGIDIFPPGATIKDINPNASPDSSTSGLKMMLRNRKKSKQNERTVSELGTEEETVLDSSVNDVTSDLISPRTTKDILNNEKTTLKTTSKNKRKLSTIKSDTVKKIARELIRKKGPSLLHFPRTAKMKSKSKSK